MTTAVPGAVDTFLLNHGQVKQLTSISTPSPNTADVTQCTNNCNNALFSHANKILLTAENKGDMAELIKCVKHNSERLGMNLNIKKLQ
jgi:hypothetical protein